MAFNTHISDVLHLIENGMQVSGDSPELGSFTLTETVLINRNEAMNDYGIVVKELEIWTALTAIQIKLAQYILKGMFKKCAQFVTLGFQFYKAMH